MFRELAFVILPQSPQGSPPSAERPRHAAKGTADVQSRQTLNGVIGNHSRRCGGFGSRLSRGSWVRPKLQWLPAQQPTGEAPGGLVLNPIGVHTVSLYTLWYS